MFKLVEDRSKKGLDLCVTVANAIMDEIAVNDKVVYLEADLGGASKSTLVEKKYPDNFIQCGISEANMVGVACGMSSEGFVPFIHTFGPFATRRVFDQVYLSGGYAHNTINIYGSDPGFTVGPNGGTHTTWEDVALMRTIPGAVVCDTCDEVQTAWVVKEFAKSEGVHYFRCNRKPVRNVYEKGSTFEMGKGNVIHKGSDVLVITAGQIVSDALDAAEELEKQGISVEVIDMFCIKPLDVELILSEVKGKKAVVTFENHSITGGLGSAVSEVLMENGVSVPFKRHGINELFGQVGTPDFLQKEFKLTASDLEETIKSLL
ncbi:transketolase family protein [Floccifex sp.]|uniref:transketolase family protein n=1 Tax=Floccifex sp. TaxID=2815810 RepID=UPI002A7668CC|nr:transketolase C-terminal domain-containing protein [Floccifex sp.]MDD7281975.1 transketolase C-terminal domain-containing protein [Erysipelotrichaceae bacterium]MDY2957884.1 transketolase C-terminal domain-containing protein [Floccifex sp.]